MAVITLTTDLGTRDFYLAAVKGFILSQLNQIYIVDITHQIEPFNIIQAAFILRNAYSYFPPDSIHIVSVDSDQNIEKEIIIVSHKQHHFIAYNNGILSMVLDEPPTRIIKLHRNPNKISTFPLLEEMARAACKLARKQNEYDMGTPIQEMESFTPVRPIIEQNAIRGKVLYIDNFGNAITNITKNHFERFSHYKKIKIHLPGGYVIENISDHYNQVPVAEFVAIFGVTGLLEIAMNKDNLVKMTSIDKDSNILIEFS